MTPSIMQTTPSNFIDTSVVPWSIIGSTTHLIQSLVTVKQLEDHLGLLQAFYDLKKSVQDPGAVIIGNHIPQWALQLDPDARWAWFVGLAVER